jgi:SAM-dependent methyltransferase
MRIGEKLLLALSRSPDTADYPEGSESVEGAVDDLREVFPRFDDLIRGKRILDYGCGTGMQCVRLAQLGADCFGLDIRERVLEVGRRQAREHGVEVTFGTSVPSKLLGTFDIVLSKDSMEHFGDPGRALAEMKQAVRPGGILMISFSPPWYAPYGGHMQFFTKLPWAHLLFSESTVMAVRSRFRSDGAKSHAEIEGGLNKMSVRRFERLVALSGLRFGYSRYDTVKHLPLGHIPLLRELFINRISCLLRNPAQ